MATDPCSCNGDQVQDANGVVLTNGTFSETVTLMGPAGLNVRISASATNTGILNPVDKLPLPLPTNLTETSPGVYQITFYHEDRIGYDIQEFEFSSGGPFMVVNTGLSPLMISNVCAYPQMVFNPALPSALVPNDPVIHLGANLVPVSAPAFTPLGGHPLFTVNGAPATVLDPSLNAGINNTIVGIHDIMPGLGMGGSIASPAIPLDADGDLTNGVCPITVSTTISVADPIPTMSEWGLIIFGLLILNLGVIFLYRRIALENVLIQ